MHHLPGVYRIDAKFYFVRSYTFKINFCRPYTCKTFWSVDLYVQDSNFVDRIQAKSKGLDRTQAKLTDSIDTCNICIEKEKIGDRIYAKITSIIANTRVKMTSDKFSAKTFSIKK